MVGRFPFETTQVRRAIAPLPRGPLQSPDEAGAAGERQKQTNFGESAMQELPTQLGAVVRVMSGPMVLASLTRDAPWYDPAADDWYPTDFVQRNLDAVVGDGVALR